MTDGHLDRGRRQGADKGADRVLTKSSAPLVMFQIATRSTLHTVDIEDPQLHRVRIKSLSRERARQLTQGADENVSTLSAPSSAPLSHPVAHPGGHR